ncbi:TOG array regulator of axonemal microtubules protein 1-like, partial [Diadema antillarum]|uniref:TOG array regulator of axonemal microtubules protein 1-like n=1 Tax=Diadema antillarum TaxID=105358 RepID=UPI003A836A52
MAGTVAKLPVYNFGQGERRTVMNGNDADIKRTMDEDDLFRQLRDDSYAQHREYIIDELISRVRKNGGKVPFKNTRSLFKGLAVVLQDTNKDVRVKCIQFIMDMVPILKQDLDSCMMLVLSDLISNFGDPKVSIRKAAVQTLHMYMKNTSNVEPIFNSIVKFGLESDDPKIRSEMAVSIPVLLTGEFSKTDLSIVAGALAKKFTEDTNLMVTAGVSLDRICSLVGEATFESYIDNLPPTVRSNYCKRTGRPDPGTSQPGSALDWNSNRTSDIKSKSAPVKNDQQHRHSTLHFGIIPQDVLDQLSNQEHWTERASGVQELNAIISDLKDTAPLIPHMINFVSFLCNLLDDSNFKVGLHTLELFQGLVGKLDQNIKPYLRHVVTALSKRFGDNKTVIRQANMKVMIQLMQVAGSKAVVHAVSELKNHRKSGVREEALNVIIAALLTFPSYDFDLPMLCRTLSQCLNDPKRRIRQASLELFAVLAQAMGPTRIGPLIDAVDKVELEMSEEGVMRAVQARLARRQLPRLNEDGLVEYASQTPSSAATTGRNPFGGHDTEWILKAARNTSAKERAFTDPGIELSQPSPTRGKYSTGNAANPESQPQKRFFSAGRGRSKLPWEEVADPRAAEDHDNGRGHEVAGHGRVQINSAPTKKHDEGPRRPPIKARNTWNGGDDVWDSTPTTRRSHAATQDLGFEQGSSGSYRQIHLDKLKRASLNTYPGRGRDNWEEHSHPSGSHSAPVTERAGPDPFIGNTAVIPKKRSGNAKPHHLSHQHSREEVEHSSRKQLSYSEKHMPSVGLPRARDEAEQQRIHRMSLSNSWPDPGIGMDDGVSANSNSRKKMDLNLDSGHDFHDIPSPNKSAMSAGTSPISPIPFKPTLARSAGRRGQQRAPLVPLEKTSPRDEYDDDWDSYPNSYRSNWPEEETMPD